MKTSDVRRLKPNVIPGTPNLGPRVQVVRISSLTGNVTARLIDDSGVAAYRVGHTVSVSQGDLEPVRP